MTDTLFRDDAIRYRYGTQPGRGSNVPPLAHHWIAVGALLLIAALASILFLGSYTASDTVRGYIEPSTGSVRVLAPRNGIIAARLAADGDTVSRGAQLLSVSAERLQSGVSVDAMLINDLQAELAETTGQLGRTGRLHDSGTRALTAQLRADRKQYQLLQSQLDLEAEHLALSATALARAEVLQQRGHLAASDLQQQRVAYLARQQARIALAREAGQLQHSIRAQQHRLDDEPLRQQNEIARLQARRLQLRRQLAQARAAAAFTLTAPVTGVVSGLMAREGDAIIGGQPLMTLLPVGSLHCAVLLVPSRTSGFIEAGDAVRVRVDAYPHQKFGTVDGTVRAKSRSVLLPGEFNAPIQFTEPAYRVEVELDAQALAARSQSLQLQPGMTVVAEVQRDRRRIIEWLLEPVIGAVGRL